MFAGAGAKRNGQGWSLDRMLWRCHAQPGLDCNLASMTPERVDGNAVGQKPPVPRSCFSEDVTKWGADLVMPGSRVPGSCLAEHRPRSGTRGPEVQSKTDCGRHTTQGIASQCGFRVFSSCGTGCSSSVHPTVSGDNLCARLPFVCRIGLYAH